MGLDQAARARLRDAAPAAAAVLPALVDRLYEQMRALPATHALLTSDELVARLKAQQRIYLHELLAAEIDWPYILRRLVIGEVHHRVRLAPQWYLATYAFMLADLLEVLLGTATTREDGGERVCALIASVSLDAGLMLDAYGRSEEAALWSRAGQPAAELTLRTAGAASPSPAPPSGGPTQIRLSTEATAERRRFLGLSDDDLQRLRGLRPLIAAHTPAILDDFYALLASRPETAALVQPDTARRLKQQVASYWMELADGAFDRPYAASRMRIGVIHEKIGVETASYLTGLARQLCGLTRAIVRERPEPLEDLRALIRAVFFDLSFVIDAYMTARVDSLLRTQGYADQLVAGLASAVAVIDAGDRLLSANRTLLTLLGGDPGTLYRLPLESALPLPEAVALVRSLRASGHAREVGVGRLGHRTMRCTAMRLAGHGSAEHAIALVLDDITDILRLGHDFTRQADQFEQVADAAGAVLWEMDVASGTITAINRAALDLTGFRDVFFLGRPWAWHERLPDRDRFTRRAAALSAGTQAELDYALRRADGSELWVRTLLRRSPDGEEPRLRGVTLDMTATRRAEVVRLESIGTIAGGVAHTVNNALTCVMGYIELQAIELGGLPQAPLLQDALAAAHSAREVAARLLAFAGKQMLRPAPLSLSEVSRAAEPRLRATLGPGTRLRLALEGGLWLCRVDREQLLTAIECLAANARDALGGAGELVVTTRNRPSDGLADDEAGCGQDWVEIEVSDTGSGMPESVRARAMDPFFTTRSLAEATGLGLSMVYGFVTQSCGHVALDSAPGVGTRVRLRFPRLTEAPHAAPAAAPTQPLLLFVEDEPEVRRLAVRMVRQLGYEVRDTGSAEEALQLAAALRPAILLTDIVIGQGTDGITLARRLADADPQLAVILTSGYAEDQFDLSRLPTGTQFLPKPFTLAMLTAALQAAIRAGQRDPPRSLAAMTRAGS